MNVFLLHLFFFLLRIIFSDGNQICMCLECGFHNSASDPVACSKREENSHTDPCKECAQGFELFKELYEFHA